MRFHYQSHYHQPLKGEAIAGLFLLLFPVLLPCLFTPFTYASPSTFSEWNVIKPRHLSLLRSALEGKSSNGEQSDLWTPLADQGWRPCLESHCHRTLKDIFRYFLMVDSTSKEWGYGIAAISPFSHRLSFDNLPSEIQQLRCKVNFKALVFVPHIRALGDAIVHRLRYPPGETEALSSDYLRVTTDQNDKQRPQKFVVLHLRFDKDMAAHSACDFGGGKAEKLALAKYRQTIWGGRVLNSQFTDEELRSQGRCPLTPEEIGLLLAALGFDNSTRLYLASHKVYGGEARISTLRELFPLMENKKSLASSEERARIKGKASLLAAVDYYVGMHSDIFVSASPGNMHNALVGHRTFENMKTIRPNMALLGQLFLNKNITWLEFRQAVAEGHQNRQGQLKLRKPKQSIYTYPAPDCMCRA
ncbi:hypothetical protein GOBAR_DD32011 [Gossypium barbadense]|nr:hypothetical protein GOBAR_DD32011 [Gossypium barbadense]